MFANMFALGILEVAFTPIFILGVTTALSRLAMFAGVKILGSMQTAILAITEIGMALALAFVLLDERLTVEQWVGVGLLGSSILLVRGSDLLPRKFNPGQLLMANISSQQFQWIAFHRAFGKDDENADEETSIMATVTTQEMQAIRDMMGADTGPMDPFPINPAGEYSIDLSIFRRGSGESSGDADENALGAAAD